MKVLYIICLFTLTTAFINKKYLFNKYKRTNNLLDLYVSNSLCNENNTNNKVNEEKIPEYVFYLSGYEYSKYLKQNLNNMSGVDMRISENTTENTKLLEKIMRNSILFYLLKSIESNVSEIKKIEELNSKSFVLNKSLLNNIGLNNDINQINIHSGGLFDKWDMDIDDF